MRFSLQTFNCLLLTFLVALHECIPLSSGCLPMLGISLICCAVLAEHVSSNASDSESSYRKLLLWFVVLFFAIAPLPVMVISNFCCCFFITALYHLHAKQMARSEIINWCGKIQKTLRSLADSYASSPNLSWLWPVMQFSQRGWGESSTRWVLTFCPLK